MNRSCLTLLTKSVNPLIILFLLCQSAKPATERLPSTESRALSTIIERLKLRGAPSVSESFCDEKHDLSYGNVINCTNINNTWHITGMILGGSTLDGYIDAAVKNLTYLQILDLSNNNIRDHIPPALGDLSHLTYLDLSSNKLTESIPPSLGNLSHLTYLNLANNKLTRSIPPSLGKLKNLIILYLYSNQLAELIPSDLGNLKRLETLDLSYNQLTGPIPKRLGNLKMLKTLDFSNNQLTGAIPSHLRRLTKLKTLYLFKNFLNDSIPPSFGNLSSLEDMDLSFNRLSGLIPGELGKLVKLETLYLKENELNGALPKELGQLSNLGLLSLSSNYFTGNLPDEYKNIATMKYFLVNGNNLTGLFPKFVTEWVNLSFLNLMGNNFEDELPDEIFTMKKLQTLMVSDLKNNGSPLPTPINLRNMRTLVLRNCNIIGQIPSIIADQNNYWNRLDLSFNKFTGVIPDSLLNLNSSSSMFLSGDVIDQTILRWINNTVTFVGGILYNNLTIEETAVNKGISHNNLAEAVKNNVNLSNINIEPNNRESLYQIMDNRCGREKSKYNSLFINAGGERINFEQNVFDEDNSTLLTTLYENSKKPWAYSCLGQFALSIDSTNYIQNITCGASVPELYVKARLCPQSLTYYGFCLHNGDYNVKLHFAEIVFAKDEDYSSLGKRVFDIYIQGEPKRRDLNIKEKTGNTPNTEWIENFKHINVHDNLLEIRLFWAGKGSTSDPLYLNGPLISAISVTRNIKPLPIAWIVVASVLTALLLFVLVLALMWRMGYLGDRDLRVTKVELGGQSYTIKQVKDATRNFSPKNNIGKGRFGMIYKAQLPDQTVAVKRLSFQSEIDQIGTEVYAMKQLKHENLVELLDVYSKKDLHLLIYEYMEKGSLKEVLFDESNSKVILDWKKRVNICLGIARGLKYLHQDHTSGKVIHRNVKASNILLDGNLNPKVSDLGLAKFYDEENPYQFIKEIGTVVYMAPEYAMRKTITDKADVYSYGVLLLEIVSGQSNSKIEENQGNDYLLNKACVLHSEQMLLNLVDTNLSGDYDKKQALKILDLAIKCINLSPTLRPTMLEIVSELEQISNVNAPSPSA